MVVGCLSKHTGVPSRLGLLDNEHHKNIREQTDMPNKPPNFVPACGTDPYSTADWTGRRQSVIN